MAGKVLPQIFHDLYPKIKNNDETREWLVTVQKTAVAALATLAWYKITYKNPNPTLGATLTVFILFLMSNEVCRLGQGMVLAALGSSQLYQCYRKATATSALWSALYLGLAYINLNNYKHPWYIPSPGLLDPAFESVARRLAP